MPQELVTCYSNEQLTSFVLVIFVVFSCLCPVVLLRAPLSWEGRLNKQHRVLPTRLCCLFPGEEAGLVCSLLDLFRTKSHRSVSGSSGGGGGEKENCDVLGVVHAPSVFAKTYAPSRFSCHVPNRVSLDYSIEECFVPSTCLLLN